VGHDGRGQPTQTGPHRDDVPTVGGFAAINGPPRQYGGTVRINF